MAGWLRVAGAAACWRVRQDAQFGVGPVEKLLGALPVVAGFSSRLRIRDIVDDACPVRDLAELTHGQVIEALVANRLTSPSPLVHVQSWARDWAVGEALGVEPGLLNDDRIGRALDAIAPHLDQIAGSVGVAAIAAFGIDVTRLHWDMTSVSVHGEYAQSEEGFPAPRFGHPKDRRPDLKQVQAGIAVSGDGGIPVFHRAFDGGAGEVGQVIPVMKALQELATQRRLLIVGDSKLISYANLAAMDSGGVTFVAPASKTYVPAAQLAGLSVEQAARGRLTVAPARYQAKPADRRGRWHVAEDTMSLAGPRKQRPGADTAPGARALLGLRRCREQGPGAEALVCPRTTWNGWNAAWGLVFTTPHRRQGQRPDRADRQPAASRRLPAGLRRQPALALGKPTLTWRFRPGCDRCRGRHRRLVRPAHQPRCQRGRHRRGPDPSKKARKPSSAATPRSRARSPSPPCPEVKPAHRRPGHRHLPGPAHLLSDRAPGQAEPRRARQDQGRGPVRRAARHPPLAG